jgi:hypothetical protein
MKQLGSFAVIMAVVAIGLKTAIAGCALGEQISLAPLSGAILPPDPTVLVFIRKHPTFPKNDDAEVVARLDGHQAPVEHEVVFDGEGYRIIRVRVLTGKSKSLTIVVSGEPKATYAISKRARVAPNQKRGTNIARAEYVYETGCPHSDGFLLTIHPWAPAYKVQWTDDGNVRSEHSVIVPSDQHSNGAGAKIAFGSIGCLAFSVGAANPFDTEIIPLFSDGTEGDTFTPGCRHSDEGTTCSSHVSFSFGGKVRIER